MKKPPPQNTPPSSEGRTIWILYILFFIVWCAGMTIGELWNTPNHPSLLGIPVWFLISCVASSIGVSVALLCYVWRCFK